MQNTTPIISFVSPVYRAEKILDKLVEEIQKVMLEINEPYEIILVDDRSPDNSWQVMQKLSENFSEVKSIRLSRNFGQHPSIMAGLSQVKGEWVVVLDCDLQDQPKEVLKLYTKAKEGYDVVLAKRKNRQDGFFKRKTSFIFSKIYSFFTDTLYDNEVANFGIYNKKVIDAILDISDYIKFFPLFVKFVGFSTTAIEVEHAEREEGNSTYTLSKLISLAFNTIISFSNKPLKLFVKFGLTISGISFLLGIYNLYLAITSQVEVLGYSSIIVSIWFLSGVIITTIGVTGIYVGKIFDQTKNRPIFVIDEIK
ncbi:dolichol-phosphate mannosyltransferase [Flavobacterium swingsii]|uniref:Dolichol-phosphate mannosyltransferase n=1 Tax=Flavobacterium swingsii TaxID=498292 RepID=A0A1I0Z629_9FLAO|nr:glycosyltransferase family 2 protein [Flavobacterium swingsii]SFB21189.1 dolichol-phosphate mannosyltransferase [Flavobacterium swingsii]